MEDLQDKYDELDNIISTLNMLENEITNKDYIEQFQEIRYQAEKELEEVQSELERQISAELSVLEIEFERSKF